ncbi:hypothetical protein Q8F55_008443 [Vanrija albida]|uniref:Uncharacterized protein n=1 Tax=Vanrija albida TaxID=181172 RepID=A0ABR3PQV6_9TREE
MGSAIRTGWKREFLRQPVAVDRKAFYLDLEAGGGAVDWRKLAILSAVTDARWAACRAREAWVTAPSHCVDYLSPTFHDVYNGSIIYVAGGAADAGFTSFALDTTSLATAPFPIPLDTEDAQDVRGAGVGFLREGEVWVTRGSGRPRALFRPALDLPFDPRSEATNDAHCAGEGYSVFRYVVGSNRDRVFRVVESGVGGTAKIALELPFPMPHARLCPDAELLLLYAGTSLAVFDRASAAFLTSVDFDAAPFAAVYDLGLRAVTGGCAPVRASVPARAARADEHAFAHAPRPRLGGIAEVLVMDGGVLLLRGTQGDIILIRGYKEAFHAAACGDDALLAARTTLLRPGYGDELDRVAVHIYGPRVLVVAPHATACVDTRDLGAPALPLILLATPNQNDHRPLPVQARATLDGRGIYQTVPLRGLRGATNGGMRWLPEWDADATKRPYFAIRAWSFEPEAECPAV